jgi:hypothetical protein
MQNYGRKGWREKTTERLGRTWEDDMYLGKIWYEPVTGSMWLRICPNDRLSRNSDKISGVTN